MKQRREPCNGVEIGVTHLSRWIDAAEKSEHTLRALAEGDEFAAQYVLANILYAEGRDDEIRDSMFLSTALSIAGCGASEPSGDTGSREQNNSADGTDTYKVRTQYCLQHNCRSAMRRLRRAVVREDSGVSRFAVVTGWWLGSDWDCSSRSTPNPL